MTYYKFLPGGGAARAGDGAAPSVISLPASGGGPTPSGGISLTYIDYLQRQNAEDLAFYPLSTLEQAIETRHILTVEENGEPAGYLWFGAVRPGRDVIIYQACIDYDLRRQHLGHTLVRQLTELAIAGGAFGIKLKCASSAESNRFWTTIGFNCTNVIQGGIKRGRMLNVYRTDLTTGLWAVNTLAVAPSAQPVDQTTYQKLQQSGASMPSRFSRSHYVAEAAKALVEDNEKRGLYGSRVMLAQNGPRGVGGGAMTKVDCQNLIRAQGWPLPLKSRCWMCPHQSNEEWRSLPKDELAQAIVLDDEIREADERGGLFLHHSRRPLSEVDLGEQDRRIPEGAQCGFGGCWT